MNTMNYLDWRNSLKALFPVVEEYELANAIYAFQNDYADGLTPTASYACFDAYVSCCEEMA